MPITFAGLGLRPSSKLRNGLHGYCLECPKRVWNDIGWKTTPATIPCLLPTGLISKNFGHFNSYIGSVTILLGYELKKTDLQCKITSSQGRSVAAKIGSPLESDLSQYFLQIRKGPTDLFEGFPGNTYRRTCSNIIWKHQKFSCLYPKYRRTRSNIIWKRQKFSCLYPKYINLVVCSIPTSIFIFDVFWRTCLSPPFFVLGPTWISYWMDLAA